MKTRNRNIIRRERRDCRKRIQEILKNKTHITLKAIGEGEDQDNVFYSPGMRSQANKMLTEQ